MARTLGNLRWLSQKETPCQTTLPTNRGAHYRARINVNEGHEVRYWTQALGVSEAKLREAVAAVGVSSDAVRQHLGKLQK